MKKGSDKFKKRLASALCPEWEGKRSVLYTTVASVLMAFACVWLVVYYICFPMEGYFHSDYTDSIYWANASVESGAILDPDFAYAGILPFSANLWLIPLISIFGMGMTAYKIGMVIFLLLLVAAVGFMCRGLGWSLRATALLECVLLMVLSGSEKLREMMWGHVIYYSLALLLLFVGIGLVARLLKIKGRPSRGGVVLCALAAVLFAGAAVNGFEIIALVSLPCIAVALYDAVLAPKRRLLDTSNNTAIVTAAGIVVATAIGYLVLAAIKGNISSSYAASHSTLSSVEEWMNNILRLPGYWFSLLGLENTSGDPIVSVNGIKAILLVALGMVLAVVPIIGLFKFKSITDESVRTVLIAHLAVSAVIVFAYVCGSLGYVNWRLLPMLGTAVLATFAMLKYWLGGVSHDSYVPKRAVAVVISVIAVCSAFNFSTVASMPYNYGHNNDLHKLTQKLEEMGLERGYATFWRSQAITLLSDSKVKTMMVLADEDLGVVTDYYQNSKKWYEDDEGTDRYFVLLSLSENATVEKCDEWLDFTNEHTVEKIYLFNSYVLYVLDTNIDFSALELMTE